MWIKKNKFQIRSNVTNLFLCTGFMGDSEFSSYKTELRKKASTFEILNSKGSTFFFYFWVTNLKLKNKKLHFELLTWRLNFYFLLSSF